MKKKYGMDLGLQRINEFNKQGLFYTGNVHYRRTKEMMLSILKYAGINEEKYDFEHIVKVPYGRDYANKYTAKNGNVFSISSFIKHSSYVFELCKKSFYTDKKIGRQYSEGTLTCFIDETKQEVYAVLASFLRKKSGQEGINIIKIGTFKMFMENGHVSTKRIPDERTISPQEYGRYDNYIYLRANAYKSQYRESKIKLDESLEEKKRILKLPFNYSAKNKTFVSLQDVKHGETVFNIKRYQAKRSKKRK